MPWETSWDEVQAMEAYAPTKREIVATDDLRLKRVAHGLANDFPYVASFWPDDPIPQMPPRDESVRVRLDYRNGPHDPLLWPQRDPLNVPHTAYFEKVELHSVLSQNIVGYVFNPQIDWVPTTEGSDMGHIRADLLTRLRWTFADVRMAVEPYLRRAKTPHLVPYNTINECNVLISEFKSLATTVREAGVNVTRLQRGIAELRAWYRFRVDVRFHLPHGDYRAPVEYNYVGVFTTDLKYAQTLHRLGIPVWVALRCLPPNFYREHVRESMIWHGRVETRHLDAVDPDMRFVDSTGRRVVGTPTEPLMWSSTAADAVPTNLVHTMPADARARTLGPVLRLGQLDNAQQPGQRTPGQRTERSRSPSRLPRDAHGSLTRQPSPPRPSSSAPVPADGAAPQAALAGEPPRPKRDPYEHHARPWQPDPKNDTKANPNATADPEWWPQMPIFLTHLLRHVDLTVDRQTALCASDIMKENRVPQLIFYETLKYVLPPLHCFARHKGNRMFYYPGNWLPIRDYCMQKLLHGEGLWMQSGLKPGDWKARLDGKTEQVVKRRKNASSAKNASSVSTSANPSAPVQPSTTSTPAAPSASSTSSATTSAATVSPPTPSLTTGSSSSSDPADAALYAKTLALEAQVRALPMAPAYEPPTHGDESDDSDTEHMPAMIQVGAPPRVDYTRPANDDERPLRTEDERLDIIPRDWKIASCTQWFELYPADRRMVFLGKKKATQAKHEDAWIIYVDYELRRILHFSAHSGIEKEHPVLD